VRVALPFGRCITIRNSSRRNRLPGAKFSEALQREHGGFKAHGAPFKTTGRRWTGRDSAAAARFYSYWMEKDQNLGSLRQFGIHDFRTEMHPNIQAAP